MGNWIVGTIVIGVYTLIVFVLTRRHRKQKSVCARCSSIQETPTWMSDYKKSKAQ
jgi:hypothetical protein